MNNRSNNPKTRRSFSEISMNKDFSDNESQWPESRRDYTNRDRLRYIECHDDRNSFNKYEHPFDIGSKVTREEQPTFPSYNYNSSDHLFVDDSRRTLLTAPIASGNSPRSANSFENIAMSTAANQIDDSRRTLLKAPTSPRSANSFENMAVNTSTNQIDDSRRTLLKAPTSPRSANSFENMAINASANQIDDSRRTLLKAPAASVNSSRSANYFENMAMITAANQSDDNRRTLLKVPTASVNSSRSANSFENLVMNTAANESDDCRRTLLMAPTANVNSSRPVSSFENMPMNTAANQSDDSRRTLLIAPTSSVNSSRIVSSFENMAMNTVTNQSDDSRRTLLMAPTASLNSSKSVNSFENMAMKTAANQSDDSRRTLLMAPNASVNSPRHANSFENMSMNTAANQSDDSRRTLLKAPIANIKSSKSTNSFENISMKTAANQSDDSRRTLLMAPIASVNSPRAVNSYENMVINTATNQSDDSRRTLLKVPTASVNSPRHTNSFENISMNTAANQSDDSRRTLLMAPTSSVNSPRSANSFENMVMNTAANQPAMPISAGLDMVKSSASNLDPYDFIGTSGENIYGVVQMGNYWQYGGMIVPNSKIFSSAKEVVKLKKCVLYPPELNASLPPIRKRPAECKMVFVRGLPEKITEEIITEIFEQCGIIESIRMSKKNSCRIKFSDESYVDKALYFSGYKLKIENKDEVPFTGILHVDYSLVSDVQHDYECKQRDRERRVSDKKKDYYKSPTPPVLHFSEYEASLICEKLKKEETFTTAANVLITWLEKGACTKRNASSFFSMIQSTHNHVLNHVKKLELNKTNYKDQLNETKKMLKKNQESIICQYKESEKIYKAASLQKCWDQFTKAQRKNIEMWKKQTEDLKNALLEEVINEREDEEMELSDDENDATSKKDTDVEQLRKQYEEGIHKYQEEVDSLKCQLLAAQNEILVMQSNHKNELEQKDNEILSIRQTLISLKEELNFYQKRRKDNNEYNEPCSFKRRRTEISSDNDKDYRFHL